MAKKWLLIPGILLWPNLLQVSLPPELIVWNVGQGQWITALEIDRCIHFDMGGEHSPVQRVLATCQDKDNAVFLSHWDRDHVNYFKAFAKTLRRSCMAHLPKGKPLPTVWNGIKKWPRCAEPLPNIHVTSEKTIGTSDRNSSFVYIYRQTWLIAGDSPLKEENQWQSTLPNPEALQFLILGHHGSSTSTGRALFSRLENLEIAIASARRARYGHPDEKLIRRLRSSGLLPLQTESFGHLRFRGYGLKGRYSISKSRATGS